MPREDRLSRREFVKAAIVAYCSLAGLGLRLRPAYIETRQTTIGWSQGGRPLIIYRHGNGPMNLFILGGQHGAPEANTTELARMLRSYLLRNPEEIPPNVTVYVMPEGNPDGLATGSRQYMSGVDPNRNWANPDWQSNAYDSNGQYSLGLGGPAPFSEPETVALGNWLRAVHPHFTINYHSAGGFMFGGGEALAGELAGLYSQASGYPRPTAGGGGGSPSGGSRLGYRVTGHLNGWQRTLGMGGCLVELTSPYDPEYHRNLAGIQAVIARLGMEADPKPTN